VCFVNRCIILGLLANSSSCWAHNQEQRIDQFDENAPLVSLKDLKQHEQGAEAEADADLEGNKANKSKRGRWARQVESSAAASTGSDSASAVEVAEAVESSGPDENSAPSPSSVPPEAQVRLLPQQDAGEGAGTEDAIEDQAAVQGECREEGGGGGDGGGDNTADNDVVKPQQQSLPAAAAAVAPLPPRSTEAVVKDMLRNIAGRHHDDDDDDDDNDDEEAQTQAKGDGEGEGKGEESDDVGGDEADNDKNRKKRGKKDKNIVGSVDDAAVGSRPKRQIISRTVDIMVEGIGMVPVSKFSLDLDVMGNISSTKRQKKHNHQHSMTYISSSGRQVAGRDYEHQEFCMGCWDGGELIVCDMCPMAYHLECLGLKEMPKGSIWQCPHHRCVTCLRRTSAASFLFR
jgi:hypothetical protein